MFPVFRQDEPGGPERPDGSGQPGPGGGPGDAGSPEWLEDLLASRRDTEPEAERNLYCFVCGEIVTSVHSRISIQGSFEHTCTNPGGYLYTIGCFREAEGCAQAGELTEAFTWFPGFAWRYAFCGSCGVHLGWVYEATRDSPERFFGLILKRLVAGREGFPSTS